MTDILSELREKAREASPKIALPEADDERVLEAGARALDLGIAQPVVFESEGLRQTAADSDVDLDDFEVVDAAERDTYAETYADLRNVTPETASEMLRDDLVLSGLLAREGVVGSFVAGAVHETATVITVANGIVGFDPAVDTGSSFFIVIFDDPSIGEDGVLLYADCGVNIDPSAEQLADIAISTAETGRTLLDWEPRVAMLSYSTKGSADHETARKVRSATDLARDADESLCIDGEIQVDAAFVPSVADQKIDGENPLGGNANVLIFPDLQAGNIAYKLSERLAGATALGPILQGYARPVSDLSRGASADDIVDVLTVTGARIAGDSGTDDGTIVTSGALDRREEAIAGDTVTTD